jgi:hypothetical protein
MYLPLYLVLELIFVLFVFRFRRSKKEIKLYKYKPIYKQNESYYADLYYIILYYPVANYKLIKKCL